MKKCKCRKNILLPGQTICWQCFGKLSSEEQKEDLKKIVHEEETKPKAYDPRSKRINQARDGKDTLQPFKKIDGKVTESKDFMDVYGTEQMHNYDPEKAKFYEKKGYKKYKRTVNESRD